MRRKATPEQIAKAKEKRTKVRELAKKIGAMSEEQRRQLVQDWPTTIEGHSVSVKNACLLALQRPGCSVIGGFRQWRRAGRYVASGPGSGMSIWIPLIRKAKDEESGEVTEDGERPGFGLATVFDISQTEACETQEPKPYQIERTLAPFANAEANQEPPQWDEIQPNEHEAPEYTDIETVAA